MISNFQISDFANRKVEAIERDSGRELTSQERKQVFGFFTAMGYEHIKNTDFESGKNWSHSAYDNWCDKNAPEVVKACWSKFEAA